MWILRVFGHPVKGIDGDHQFEHLIDMERFVGDKDVRRDMVKSIRRIRHGSETVYDCYELMPVSAVRMMLSVKDTKYHIERKPPRRSVTAGHFYDTPFSQRIGIKVER